eukprot:TRINITY_DN122_c0_g1_i6.p1 TRINITY_DN122_c0_g1~~TRINITY_DN122_c0_g1_i6.p1  ORF type:complete len:677 (+),score=197.00 TRINITY_DN122_c0_g1_i6:136-2166(+)
MVLSSTIRRTILVLSALLAFAGLSLGATQTLCNNQRYDLNKYACMNNQLRPIIKCADQNTTATAVYRYALILDNYLLVNSGLTPEQLLVKYGQYFHDVELYYKLNFNINMKRIYTFVETTPSFSDKINGTLLDDFGAALRRTAFGANMPRDLTQYFLLTGRGWPSDNVVGLAYLRSACSSVFPDGNNYAFGYDISAADLPNRVIEIAIHELSHTFGGDHPDTYKPELYNCDLTRPSDPNADNRMMRSVQAEQSPSNPSPLGYYYLNDNRYISECATMSMHAHMDGFKCMWEAPTQDSVIFYNQPNYAGDSYTANLRYSVTDCTDISTKFNDQAQSFRFNSANVNKFTAIRFWSEWQCSGDSIVVTADQLANLGDFGYGISSFDVIYFEGSTCPRKPSSTSGPAVATSTTGRVSTTASSSSSTTTGNNNNGGTCAVSVRQTLTNSWQSGSQTYSQYEVVYTNAAASGATQVRVQISGGALEQFWGVEKKSDNLYHLPSYLSNGLASGSTFTWGYVIVSNRPASINVVFPACSSPTTGPAASSTSGRVVGTTTSGSVVTSTSTTTGFGSSSTTGQPSTGTCTATVSQSIANSWGNGGQVTVIIRNTGTKAITSVQFSITRSSTATLKQIWNASVQKSGAYAPDAWALPLAPGATLNSIGYTYEGSASSLEAFLGTVVC